MICRAVGSCAVPTSAASILDMSILDRASFVVELHFRPNGFSIIPLRPKGPRLGTEFNRR